MGERKHSALDNEIYAEWLQKRRWDLDLTLREVEEATGIQIKTLWAYEQARCRPSADKQKQLESFYNRLEAERIAATLQGMTPQAREALRLFVRPVKALIAKLEELCPEPASEDAGADQKVRDEE